MKTPEQVRLKFARELENQIGELGHKLRCAERVAVGLNLHAAAQRLCVLSTRTTDVANKLSRQNRRTEARERSLRSLSP